MHGKEDTKAAVWFSEELTPEVAPWAYSRGLPYKTISALELFATLMCMRLFRPLAGPLGSKVRLLMKGDTDNRGNSFVIKRLMTTRFPLSLILMEAAAMLHLRGDDIELDWLPRDLNQEADDLTNGRFDAFTPERRIRVDWRSQEWLVLNDMARSAEELFTISGTPGLRPSGRGWKSQ